MNCIVAWAFNLIVVLLIYNTLTFEYSSHNLKINRCGGMPHPDFTVHDNYLNYYAEYTNTMCVFFYIHI